MDYIEYLNFANSLVDDARDIIKKNFLDLDQKFKSDGSIVTKIDCEIETYFRSKVMESYPTHGFIGEEFTTLNSNADYCWVADPIDGTEELTAGMPLYGTMLALRVKGQFKLGVIDHCHLNLRLTFAEGQEFLINKQKATLREFPVKHTRLGISKRINFSRRGNQNNIFLKLTEIFPNCRIYDTCYLYSLVLMGSLDCYVDFNVKVWDVAAPIAIAKGIGLEVFIIDQYKIENIEYYSIAIGNKNVLAQIKEIFNLIS